MKLKELSEDVKRLAILIAKMKENNLVFSEAKMASLDPARLLARVSSGEWEISENACGDLFDTLEAIYNKSQTRTSSRRSQIDNKENSRVSYNNEVLLLKLDTIECAYRIRKEEREAVVYASELQEKLNDLKKQFEENNNRIQASKSADDLRKDNEAIQAKINEIDVQLKRN